MEMISERDRILLGDAPRDPFAGVVLSSQRRSSGVDFHDVFGGPPRRSSIYESRMNRADSTDLYCREKPAFGDWGGSGRRSQLGDDFYSDIFQSSDSACSSPKKSERDAFQSSPGSRFSSLDGPTPIRSVPLFGGSLPPQSRNEDDQSDPFGFPSSPNASSTGFFTTQSVEGHGDLRNNSYASYRQNPLPRRIPSIFEGLSDTMEPAFQNVESQVEKNSRSLEDYISNRQFHFSIYKWAGKGVILVMPSDSNDRNEIEGRLTRFPEVIVQELELPSYSDYFSPLSKAFKPGTVTQEKKLDNKDVDNITSTAKGLLHAESDSELLKCGADKTSEKCGNQSEKTSVLCFDENSNTNCMNEKHNLEFKFNAHGEQNHELKSLSQLFDDDIDKLRSDDIPRQVKESEAQSKSQKKQQPERKSRLDPGEENCTTLHDTPHFSEDNTRGNKVKGKVKEFIRKFNQEGLPKRKGAFEMLLRMSKGEENRQDKGEENRQDKVDEEAHVSSIGENKLLGKHGNNNIPLFDIPKAMENQVLEMAADGISCDGCHSEEKIEVLPTKSELTPEVLGSTAGHEENFLEEFEGFLVQQLPLNLTEAAQNSPQQDQIKNLDDKIRQWSRGKEGNIRSLLSTLQLVLWPESGWKQVPLVNIIEGPSVKKAYQKALLCLHPDKLQQKGASSDQKYIAEKVFDILQEAWDHFNSSSEF